MKPSSVGLNGDNKLLDTSTHLEIQTWSFSEASQNVFSTDEDDNDDVEGVYEQMTTLRSKFSHSSVTSRLLTAAVVVLSACCVRVDWQ